MPRKRNPIRFRPSRCYECQRFVPRLERGDKPRCVRNLNVWAVIRGDEKRVVVEIDMTKPTMIGCQLFMGYKL